MGVININFGLRLGSRVLVRKSIDNHLSDGCYYGDNKVAFPNSVSGTVVGSCAGGWPLIAIDGNITDFHHNGDGCPQIGNSDLHTASIEPQYKSHAEGKKLWFVFSDTAFIPAAQQQPTEGKNMNPFRPGELVSKRNGTDRIDGVVKYNTCYGATGSGGKVCSSKNCPHGTKDYVWVEWQDGKLYSYKSNELMTSEDKMLQLEREKELAMEQKSEKPSFVDNLKNEGKEAAYRVASTQMTKGVKTGICAALAKKGQSSEKIAAIAEFLEGELGSALISCGLGYGLPHVPGIGEDTRVQKLASEFRVQGYATVGNELIGAALEHVLPQIQTALAALPKEETKARIVEHKEEKKSEENEEEETSLAKVAKTMKA